MATYDNDPAKLAAQLAEKAGTPADSIADIRVNTSLDGAASLEVDVIDPDFEALESGKLTPRNRKITTTNPDVTEAEAAAGHGPYALPVIDVNYPVGSQFWWRLSDVDVGDELTGPNLTLTFETRIVAYLRHHHGPPLKSMSRANSTRARFVKWITADEVKAGGGIVFVSPELDTLQPILEPEG